MRLPMVGSLQSHARRSEMTDKQTQQVGADPIDATKPASPVARAPFEPRPADECSGDVTADGGSCGGGGTVKADKGL
jgi:hypothetical protein